MTKEVYNPSKQVFDRALGAIKLDASIKADQELLKEDKAWLIREGDVGKTIIIPNVGKVQIKNGVAAKDPEAFKNYSFSIEKFEELSPPRKKALIEAGVVVITTGMTPARPAGEPTIAFIHNN